MVSVSKHDVYSLTESGSDALKKGSPEFRVLEVVKSGVCSKNNIEVYFKSF